MSPKGTYGFDPGPDGHTHLFNSYDYETSIDPDPEYKPEDEWVSEDGKFLLCVMWGCPEKIKNHAWGRIKAEGWFQQKDGRVYCPKHVPEWVAEWRAKRKA